MRSYALRWVGWASLGAIVLGGVAGCGGFMPYYKMAQAAGSLESARAQAEDQRLQFELRRAIMMDQTLSALGISPHVYMAQGFLVGRVDTQAEADALVAVGQGVSGLRSVTSYLPVSPPAGTSVLAADVETEGEIKAEIASNRDLVPTRYTVSVIDAHAVLLGVVESTEESNAVEAAARSVGSVKGVTNFLLLIEEPYAGRRPRLR